MLEAVFGVIVAVAAVAAISPQPVALAVVVGWFVFFGARHIGTVLCSLKAGA